MALTFSLAVDQTVLSGFAESNPGQSCRLCRVQPVPVEGCVGGGHGWIARLEVGLQVNILMFEISDLLGQVRIFREGFVEVGFNCV